MIPQIIISAAAIFGLLYSIRTKDTLAIIISAGLSVGIAIALLSALIYRPVGFYIYMLFVLVAAIYALVKDGLVLRQRIFLLLICASVFTYWLFSINHWHGNLWLLMIVPVITFIWWLVCKVKIKNELGFVVIMVADALAVIFEYWIQRIQ